VEKGGDGGGEKEKGDLKYERGSFLGTISSKLGIGFEEEEEMRRGLAEGRGNFSRAISSKCFGHLSLYDEKREGMRKKKERQ